MRFHTLILVLIPAAFLACASGPRAGDDGGSDANANRITAEQIARVEARTAYDVIDRLHRTWWRDLSAESGTVVVYWNNNQKIEDGSREVLRQIPSNDVVLLERVKSADAIARFGLEAKGGAIVVTRR